MSPGVLARVGRHRQRYENEFRLVAGCIPYKLKPVAKPQEDGCVDLTDSLEVLMISSPGRHDLVFPKGGWENDETTSEAACREALEEAGVRGILHETILGEWIFRSKSSEKSCSDVGACKGYMFALEVKEELQYWPEQSTHKRKWVNVDDALKFCRYPWMREALASCIQLLSKSMQLPCDRLLELLMSYQKNPSEITERSSIYQEPSSCYSSIDVSDSPGYLLIQQSV